MKLNLHRKFLGALDDKRFETSDEKQLTMEELESLAGGVCATGKHIPEGLITVRK